MPRKPPPLVGVVDYVDYDSIQIHAYVIQLRPHMTRCQLRPYVILHSTPDVQFRPQSDAPALPPSLSLTRRQLRPSTARFYQSLTFFRIPGSIRNGEFCPWRK
jgi:hypothetical protein